MTLLTLLETSYLPRTEAYTHIMEGWVYQTQRVINEIKVHSVVQSPRSVVVLCACKYDVARTEIAGSNHEFLGLFAYLK